MKLYSSLHLPIYIKNNLILQREKNQTLALLDDKHKGANWYKWRTRLQPIRTASEINAHIKILPIQLTPLYQTIAQKANQLRLLGMTYPQIAKSLQVSKKTILKALNHLKKGE